uniref:Uncharacterized protein n=1 Tax=Plectus sambesii TaxID=2011161 RepID=A0A914X934_9BILA
MAQLFEVTYNGCRCQLSRLNPTVLSALFRLEKTTIILIDADDTVFLWDDERFDKIEMAKQPLMVEGSAAVHLPPPGNCYSIRQKALTQTKQLAVQRVLRSDNGKPGIPVQLVHIAITREEAKVPKINEKLQAIAGFKELLLCNVQGVPFSDDEATQSRIFYA